MKAMALFPGKRAVDIIDHLEPGDLAVMTVRRPCRHESFSCRQGRQDFCCTGDFIERVVPIDRTLYPLASHTGGIENVVEVAS